MNQPPQPPGGPPPPPPPPGPSGQPLQPPPPGAPSPVSPTPVWQPAAARPRGPYGQPMFGPVELASWGSRVGAALLDALLVFIPFLVAIPFAVADSTALHAIAGGLFVLWLAWGWFVYYPVFMSRAGGRNGQSPGKQIVGIRVIRDRGETMSYGWALLRQFVVIYLLFGVVGSFFFGIPALLDVLWPLWDESNRALHDMIVSTHVVRADPSPGSPPPPPGGLEQTAQRIGLT